MAAFGIGKLIIPVLLDPYTAEVRCYNADAGCKNGNVSRRIFAFDNGFQNFVFDAEIRDVCRERQLTRGRIIRQGIAVRGRYKA